MSAGNGIGHEKEKNRLRIVEKGRAPKGGRQIKRKSHSTGKFARRKDSGRIASVGKTGKKDNPAFRRREQKKLKKSRNEGRRGSQNTTPAKGAAESLPSSHPEKEKESRRQKDGM